MITKTRARKSDLAEFFALDKLPTSGNIMRQKLIAMARNKEPRPHYKTKEGQALSRYTNKSSKSYCPKFDKLIRIEAISWFPSKNISKKHCGTTNQTIEAKILKAIQQNPGINVRGIYRINGNNISASDVKDGLDRLRKSNKIHFKIVASTGGRNGQAWYPSSQTKEEKEISDIWINLKEIQEEIQKYFIQSKPPKSGLSKIKKMIKEKIKF